MALRRTLLPVVMALAISAAACSGSGSANGSVGSGSTEPTGSVTGLPLPALQLAVLSAVGGHLSYCDPDLYPVQQGTELESARRRLPIIRADRAAFAVILAHEHLNPGTRLSPADLIQVNDDYKQMHAIRLTRAGAVFRFEVSVPQPGSDVGVWALRGTVDRSGSVAVTARRPGRRPICPICLAEGTLIATPGGQVPVQDLRVGMPVLTLDAAGRTVRGVVLRLGAMEAPLGHEVVRVHLADGRTFVASPGHPTVDGRSVGALRVGARYAGSAVVGISILPYTGFTWDLLPSGPTGAYLANRVPLESSLWRGDQSAASRRLAMATLPAREPVRS
jgi:hypothetical protein